MQKQIKRRQDKNTGQMYCAKGCYYYYISPKGVICCLKHGDLTFSAGMNPKCHEFCLAEIGDENAQPT